MFFSLFAMTFQASPAPISEPVTFAFVCRIAGTLAPDNKMTPFPRLRNIALLINKTGENFSVEKTIDPSNFLDGSKVERFHERKEVRGSFGALTNFSFKDERYTLLFDPKPTAQHQNQWQIALSTQPNSFKAHPSVGLCLRFDKMSQTEFDRFVAEVMPKI